jgi:hypothetical protein
MPRLNVIVLDQHRDDLNTYNIVLWADVPAARQIQYAVSGAKSIWSGATAQDNANIANGSVAERSSSYRIPSGTPLGQIETILQNVWQDYQTQITNTNLWQRYGSTWDPIAGWTILSNP